MRYSYYFLTFLLYLFTFGNSFAQAGSQDSIRYYQENLSLQTKPEERAPILAKLTWFYSETGEFEKAMKTASEAIPILEKFKNYEKLSRTYSALAQVFQYQNDFRKSNEYLAKALQTTRLTNNKNLIVTATMNYAVGLSDNKKFHESIKVFNDALKMAIEIKDSVLIRYLYLNIASAYYDGADYDKIIPPVTIGLKMSREANDIGGILRGEAILGGALIWQRKFEEAD